MKQFVRAGAWNDCNGRDFIIAVGVVATALQQFFSQFLVNSHTVNGPLWVYIPCFFVAGWCISNVFF